MEYTKKYKNGLRLVVKEIPSMYSVTTGVIAGTGSTNESKENNGISHFIEHMLFKGTKKMSAFEIADAVDKIGGQINAFTSKEITCYYTKTTDAHIQKSFEILSDIFFNSVFDDGEMIKERAVVLEEIAMVEDTPDEVCQELISQAFYGDNPLGFPILGNAKNVKGFYARQLFDYMRVYYNPQNVVISIAGNIKFKDADALTQKYFADKFANPDVVTEFKTPKHKPKSNFLFKAKDAEQANLCISYPSKRFNDKDISALMIFNNIFGSGMSSRLFQKIREQKGLAYSVYSYLSAYRDNGLYTVYAGVNPKNIGETVKTIKKEIDALLKTSFSKDEFNRGKEQLKGSFVLGQESTSSIMNLLGKHMLISGELFSVEGKINEINAVTMEQTYEALRSTFDASSVCASLVCKKDFKTDILEIFNNA
jgi:predicted Zn-dependent peptidase